MKKNILSIFILSLTILSGCASKKEDKYTTMTAQQILDEGKESLDKGSFQSAIEHFDQVEARFPYGSLAEQARLNKIYAHYHDQKYDDALREVNSFLKLYPNHPHADYVLYMKGVINFDRARSILDKLMPPDRTKIDQKQLKESLNAFVEVIEKYPNGTYVADSAQRVVYLRNILAESEVNIATFYLERNAYVGAANRAQHVLDDYDGTAALASALYVQVKAYRALGLNQLADDRLRIFQLNFSGDERLKELTN